MSVYFKSKSSSQGCVVLACKQSWIFAVNYLMFVYFIDYLLSAGRQPLIPRRLQTRFINIPYDILGSGIIQNQIKITAVRSISR